MALITVKLIEFAEKCAFVPSTLIDNALVDDNPSTDLLTEDDFLNFFKAMPSIKHLELTTGWGPLLTENVMAYLMFRPGLEKFSMGAGSLLRYSTVRQALSENPDLVIFPHMRSLHVTAEDRALRLLLPLLRSLQSVEIDVDDCLFPVDIARYVSSCTRLEEIFYYWERGALKWSIACISCAPLSDAPQSGFQPEFRLHQRYFRRNDRKTGIKIGSSGGSETCTYWWQDNFKIIGITRPSLS